jgi:hypothetical protein
LRKKLEARSEKRGVRRQEPGARIKKLALHF